MIAGGADLLYRQALAAGHEPYTRFEVFRGATRLASDLTIINGSVTATLGSQVTRTLDLTVPEGLYPMVAPTDLLAPYGNEIRAWRGVRFAEGSRYEFPVFRGRIWEQTLGDQGDVMIHAQDRAADVVDNRFRTPQNSQQGALVDEEVRRVISDALPDAAFGASDSYFLRVPQLTWEYERGSALDELATSCGSFWYALADGQFVLRVYPWTVQRTPVAELSDGDGGIVVSSRMARSRSGIYNVVTATGERLDGSTPAFGSAEDDGATSPTSTTGGFGVRSLLRRLNTPATNETAHAAANQLLKRATALTEAWTVTMIPDASLELGDAVTLNVRGRRDIVQVIQSITIPLDTIGRMQLTCRALVLDQLADQGGIGL